MKLTAGHKNLLPLIHRDIDAEGWTPVSAQVLPLILALPSELVTIVLQDSGARVRLTQEGENVMRAMKWFG